MKLTIEREACCAADDQLGPLSMTLDVPASTPLADLAERIRETRFLQFSSTHRTLHAACRSGPLWSIDDAVEGDGRLVFVADPRATVERSIPDGCLGFRFRVRRDPSIAFDAAPIR